MKKKFIYPSVFTFLALLVLPGCSDDEPHSIKPSPRDGLYEGKNLTVTIDGENITSVKSVRIFSEIIGYGYDENGATDPSFPVYHTLVTINGFPDIANPFVFTTVSTLYSFEGTIQVTDALSPINGQNFEYMGTFTGDPYSNHNEQGLVLEFNRMENPLLEN